jgi:Uma2 family endonuclease
MGTLHRDEPVVLPPLVPGEQLDRRTFHERYEAMPPNTRAELIGGVVYVSSPRCFDHGEEGFIVLFWLGHYQRFTRGIQGSARTTILLDDQAETEPDALLLIKPECGGQTHTEGDYLAGAPELVVEIARSSKAKDLGPKLKDYERAGVREYLVIALDPDEIHWFMLRDRQFQPLSQDTDGWFRSRVFPGLWLDPKALFSGDSTGLIRAVDEGIATPEHAAFVARLGEERQGREHSD